MRAQSSARLEPTMLYDVYMLTLWLVIALALGGIVGWATFSAGRRQPWF